MVRDDATTADEVIGLTALPVRSPLFSKVQAMWRHGDVPGLVHMSVGKRFGLLVGLAVMGAVSFGAAYHLAERRIDAMLVSQDGYRRLNDLAGDVRAKAEALQNHQEQFLRERDPAQAQEFRQDVAFVGQSLAAMSGLPEAGPRAAQVAVLTEGFRTATQRFEGVARQAEILGLSDNQGLRGRLAASVKAVEDELKMWPHAGSLLPEMLQMRQAEKNFMLYGLSLIHI